MNSTNDVRKRRHDNTKRQKIYIHRESWVRLYDVLVLLACSVKLWQAVARGPRQLPAGSAKIASHDINLCKNPLPVSWQLVSQLAACGPYAIGDKSGCMRILDIRSTARQSRLLFI
jgi:hypothetical protein